MKRGHCLLTLSVSSLLCLSLGLAQSYRCDWSVVGMGGGEMTSGAYKCVATAGQTASGFMTSPDYWALIGFWLPEGQSGAQGESYGKGELVTRLYAPQPNPFRGRVAIRYSLAAPIRASVQVCDLAGRVVKALANRQEPGRYGVTWDGRDASGRRLANGIYFCRLTAGDYTGAEKLVLQR